MHNCLTRCMTIVLFVIIHDNAHAFTTSIQNYNTAVKSPSQNLHVDNSRKRAFVTSPTTPTSRTHSNSNTKSKQFLSLHDISSILLSSEELETAAVSSSSTGEWRQYVPLIASGFVILDILLGSPFLNVVTAPMKRAAEQQQDPDSPSSPPSSSTAPTSGGGILSLFALPSPLEGEENQSKERVDSEAIANEALNKARNSLELRNYLEENKTNEQRYEEMRRQIDGQMDDFDGGRFGPGGKGIYE